MISEDTIIIMKDTSNKSDKSNSSYKPEPEMSSSISNPSLLFHQNNQQMRSSPFKVESKKKLKRRKPRKELKCLVCESVGVRQNFFGRFRQYCSHECLKKSKTIVKGPTKIVKSPHVATNQTAKVFIGNRKKKSVHQKNGIIPKKQIVLGVCDNKREADFEGQSRQNFGLNYLPSKYVNVQTSLSVTELPPVHDLSLFQNIKQYEYSQTTYSWDKNILLNPDLVAAPTSLFKHAPMADIWHKINVVGLIVEVQNKEPYENPSNYPNVFWFASVLRVEGYKAILRYLGFENDGSKDFCTNLCSRGAVYPVTYAASHGIPLIPPKQLNERITNWNAFLMQKLSDCKTLPINFSSLLMKSIRSRVRIGMTVEVFDKTNSSQVKVANVDKVCGKRIQLRYYNSTSVNKQLFWCHEESPNMHFVGWAQKVGHCLNAPKGYEERVRNGKVLQTDVTEKMLCKNSTSVINNSGDFKIGMKLEVIDPLKLGSICSASVSQILNDGYFMITVNTGGVKKEFCYHRTSTSLFPVGFCASNGITIVPPSDYVGTKFNWSEYLGKTNSIAAPVSLFNNVIPNHGFKVGMKIEATDLVNPGLVCVATVMKVLGRLLRIKFDGWGKEFEQWMDCESCEIYPVGWCEMNYHKLEAPKFKRGNADISSAVKTKQKKK